MPRYVTGNPKERASWWHDDTPMLPHLTVDDHTPVDTGLVDAEGNPIYRLPNPIGFGRDHEW